MDKHILLTLSLLPLALFAKPSGPDVVQGEATFAHPTKTSMQIVTGDRTIIHWDDFSIDANETTYFIQPGSSSAVLNRVTKGQESLIMGSIIANGKVFLLNPNGILIGPEATIDTHGFVASTLDVLDSEFMKGGDLRFRGNSDAKVVNLGTIHAWDGDIALIGRFAENKGTLRAPKGLASIAVGKEVLLKPSGEERIFISALSDSSSKKGTGISNQGDIEALKVRLLADGNPYKLAINHTGNIDATKVENRNGEIYLVAENGTVEVHGTMQADKGEIRVLGETVCLHENSVVDASSHFGAGKVFIGGSYQGKNKNLINSQYTFMHEGATIRVNSYQEGDGGLAVLWSDGSTHFHGLIEAQGGENSGNGGTVEVSGKRFLDITSGEANRPAKAGTPGKLLLDPNDVLITNQKTTGISFFPPKTYMPTGAISTLSVYDLIALLNTGPVEITTNSAYGGNGDITIATNMDSSVGLGYATEHALTLSCHRDLIVQASVQNSGTGDIICNVGRDLRMDGSTSGTARLGSQLGNVFVHTGRHVLMIGGPKGQAHIGFDNPYMKSNIEMVIGKDLILQAVDNFALIGHTNTCKVSPASFNGDVTIHKVGGDVLLTSLNQDNAFAQIGLASDQDNSDTSGPAKLQGNVSIRNVEGSMHLKGGTGGKGAYALIGHGGRERSFTDCYEGNIAVHVKGDINILGGSDHELGKFSGIGYGQEFATPTTHVFKANTISVDVGKDLYIQAGCGKNSAFIGAFTGTRTGDAQINIDSLRVKTGEKLTLLGNSSKSSSAESIIGVSGVNGPAQCAIDITAGHSLEILGGQENSGYSNAAIASGIHHPFKGGSVKITVLNGDALISGGDQNQAFIRSNGDLDLQVLKGNLHISSYAPSYIESKGFGKIYAAKNIILNCNGYPASITHEGPFDIEAGKNILLNRNSSIENANGILTVIAGEDIHMCPRSLIRNTTGNPMKIIVDNQAHRAPSIGTGALLMEEGSAIHGSGMIQVFTAKQNQNKILGTIGGEFFTPEALFSPQSKEKWLSYYSGSFFSSSSKFTIFYKNGVLSPGNIERSQLLVSEMLTRFHPADEFLGWFMEFQTGYAAEESARIDHKVTSSFQVIPDQLYYLRMRKNYDQSVRNANFITFPKPLNTGKE